jgi:hypothetical protein
MVPTRVRGWLAKPALGYALAAMAAALVAPSFGTGLAIDDHFQKLAVQGRLAVHVGPLDLFRLLPPDPVERHALLEKGFGAWWSPPAAQVSHFRPLASLTHFADYALWPGASALMHAENAAWYAGLVVGVTALYRRLVAAPWAGLAAALYAFDHAHGGPVGWIANRNAMMSTLFGVLSLLAHDQWRRERSVRAGWLAPLLLLAALLSAESGVGIAGYLAAYALVLDSGRTPSRWRSLLPAAATVVVWRVGYRALGYGIVGSGISADPLMSPAAFAARALESVPIQLASDAVGVPADPLVAATPGALPRAAVAAWIVVAVTAAAALPLLRRDAPSRFFALGAALAALPLGATLPTDRYLFWVGLGVLGLLSRLVAAAAGEVASAPLGRSARALTVVLLVLRGIVSPLLFPLRAIGFAALEDNYERVAATLPRGPAVPSQTVVLVNAPNDLIAMMLPVLREAHGGPTPGHVYLLYSGLGGVDVERSGPRSIDVTALDGWIPAITDRTLRASPFRVGEAVELERMRAEVRALTRDARAQTVRFTFPVDLADASLAFVTWGPRGLAPFVVPAAGENAQVPPAPLLVRTD